VKALVTDLHSRKSVAAIRELASHGWQPIGMGRGMAPMGRFSKYLHGFSAMPADPNAAASAEAILTYAEQEGADAILPLEEETVAALIEARSQGASVPALLPSAESFAHSRDKWLAWQAAQAAGVHAPRTWLPEDAAGAQAIAAQARSRLVVKPRIGTGSRGITWLDDPAELQALLETNYWPAGTQPIVQEAVAPGGAGIGAFFVLDGEGLAVGSYSHRRIREYPAGGGPSTCCVSERNQEALDSGLRLCKQLGLSGPVMVEFKEEGAAGQLSFLEINPRPWGSLALGAQSGVPVAHLSCLLAAGAPCEVQPDFEEDHEFRWIWPGELLHLATGPGSVAQRWRAARLPGDRSCCAIVSAADPGPIAGMALEMARRLLRPGSLR